MWTGKGERRGGGGGEGEGVGVGGVVERKKRAWENKAGKRDAREVDAAFEDVMSGRGEKDGEDKSRVTH